jgi:hypothetical protein
MKMENMYFKPWIGEQYVGSGNHRLLILGESHHSTEPKGPTFTIDLTREYSEGLWTHRYWTNIMQAVDGRRHWEIDKKNFGRRKIMCCQALSGYPFPREPTGYCCHQGQIIQVLGQQHKHRRQDGVNEI